MPQTFREYPVMEANLALFSKPMVGGFDHCDPGDIISIFKPNFEMGSATWTRYLAIRLYGLDKSQMSRLTVPIEDTTTLDSTGEPVMALHSKRRYCIPLSRLQGLDARLDISKLLDSDEVYQPFLSVDTETGHYVSTYTPFPVQGLVFDKQTGRFL